MSEMVHQTLYALEIIYAKFTLSARKYWINNRKFFKRIDRAFKTMLKSHL